jgi:hypothetical protein
VRRLPLLPNGNHSHVCVVCAYEDTFALNEGCGCEEPDAPLANCTQCRVRRATNTLRLTQADPAPPRRRGPFDLAPYGTTTTWGPLNANGVATPVTLREPERYFPHRHHCLNCDASGPVCQCGNRDAPWSDCTRCNREPEPCKCCKIRKARRRTEGSLCSDCTFGHEKGRPTRLHLKRTHCKCCKAYCGARMRNAVCGWCAEHCDGTHVTSGKSTGAYHQHACKYCGSPFLCDKVPACTITAGYNVCVTKHCGFCGQGGAVPGAHRHSCRGVGERRCGATFYCHIDDRASQPQCWKCRNTPNKYQVRVPKEITA